MTDHTISRDKRVPLKYQVADYISSKIKSGEYKPGDRIPSENDLRERFGVSRITVVNALNYLENEGFIVRIQGKGSFVKGHRFTRDLNSPKGFTSFFRDSGVPSRSTVLECYRVAAPPEVRERLDLCEGSEVIVMKRLRIVDDEPVAITTSFLDVQIGQGLLKYNKGDNVSLYEYLTASTGKQVLSGPIYLEPIPLNNAQAKLLKVKVGSCGCITKTTTLIDDRTVEYVVSVLRGDKFRFVVHRINYSGADDSAAGIIL